MTSLLNSIGFFVDIIIAATAIYALNYTAKQYQTSSMETKRKNDISVVEFHSRQIEKYYSPLYDNLTELNTLFKNYNRQNNIILTPSQQLEMKKYEDKIAPILIAYGHLNLKQDNAKIRTHTSASPNCFLKLEKLANESMPLSIIQIQEITSLQNIYYDQKINDINLFVNNLMANISTYVEISNNNKTNTAFDALRKELFDCLIKTIDSFVFNELKNIVWDLQKNIKSELEEIYP